jgi:hypothetical protein
LREFLRRQAEQKREIEMKERIEDSKQDLTKVVGILKNSVEREALNNETTKEAKQKKLQD